MEVVAMALLVSLRLSLVWKPNDGCATHTTLTSLPGTHEMLPFEVLLPLPPQPPQLPEPQLLKNAQPAVVNILPATSRKANTLEAVLPRLPPLPPPLLLPETDEPSTY